MSLDATPALAEPAASPSPAPETAPAPAPEAAAAAPEKREAPADTSLDDDLAAVYRKATQGQERDESGRFVGQEKPAEAQPETPPAAEAQPEAEKPAAAVAVPPPSTWNAEQRAVWAKLPPEAQTLVAAREQELHSVKSDYGRLQGQYQPVKQVLDEFGEYLQAVGVPAPQFLRRMLATSHALDRDPGSVIKQLADAYGINLGDLWDPSAPVPDPEVVRLRADNERLRSQHEQSTAQQRAAEQVAGLDAMNKLVEQFGEKHPEIKDPEMQKQLAVQIRGIQAVDPTMDPAALLAQAYEQAAWNVKSIRDARLKAHADTLERARVEAAKKAAEAAAKAGSINVNGAVRPSGDGGDLDADLRNIWRKNANR